MSNTAKYMYGSAAPKIDEQQRPIKKTKPTASRTVNNSLKKKKTVIQKAAFPKGKLIVTLSLIFVLVFMLIYRYAVITELNYSIDEMTNEYKVIADTNQKLRFDIENKTDLKSVEQIAKQKLGMHKPDKYQIICLNVPKTSYTTVITDIQPEEKNILDSLSEKLCTLTKIFVN